jgi:hypothetical protein
MTIAGLLRDMSLAAARSGVPSDSPDAMRPLPAEPRLFRNREFGEGRNQFPPARTSDDRFIAGELAIECNPHSSQPDERMEPQRAE